MSARRFFVSLLLLATACRCGDEDIVVPVAHGVAIAPWAKPELYLDRLEQLDARTLLVSWTDPSTDLDTLREAVKGRDLELIIGLEAARTPEDEHNRPSEASSGLDAAIDRALVLGEELDGVHLDHQDAMPPQNLDATIAAIRAKTGVPISHALRPRTVPVQKIMEAGFPAPPEGTTIEALDSREDALAWASAWGGLLAGKVDRVVVHTGDRDLTGDLELLKTKLGTTELWATVDLTSAVRSGRSPVPSARAREDARSTIDVLRSRDIIVLASGAEYFRPHELLGPDSPTTGTPNDPDSNLERRANDVDDRLRRCCVRDGQIVSVYDHRFERDAGDNMWQEDACWMTGLYAAAMSFKFAVTQEDGAAARAREAWRALHQMANTTPLKGEVVRNYSRVLTGVQPEPPAPGSDTIKRWRRAEDRELYWVGDISVDQLSGWFNGVAAFHDLVATDDEKREIAADVKAVLDIFLEHDLKMIEFTGEETTFGNLRSSPVLALAFFQIGFHITKEQKYRDEFLRLLEKENMQFSVGTTLALYHSAGRFGSDHFYSSGFYPLITYETDPAQRRRLELGFEIFHLQKRSFGDAYADMVYGVFHPTSDAWRRAMHEIRNYRPEFTENAGYFAEVSTPHAGPFVPIDQRPPAELDFDYAPPGPAHVRGGAEARFTGIGYLLSYWMGRYHGLTKAFF